ncbi:MAG: hypothetical protein CMJ84_00625 [Planctomycetes bacterium]|nr:hypothetical protein [Planctomycetota bacterium]
MAFLVDLWLPILLSAVGVFAVSTIIHMVVQWHNNDYVKMDSEEAVLSSLRDHGLKPGQYMFPRAESMQDMGTPEYAERCNLGPVGWGCPGFR